MTTLHMRISADLHNSFKQTAKKNKVSISEVVRTASVIGLNNIDKNSLNKYKDLLILEKTAQYKELIK